MGYALLVVYLALTYTRPADFYPELAAYRYMVVAGIVALLASAFGVITGRGPTLRAPQAYLVLLFGAWVSLSVILSGWLGGGAAALAEFSVPMVVFFLLLLNVDSVPRGRQVALLLVVLTLIQTSQGIHAYLFADKATFNVFILRERIAWEDKFGEDTRTLSRGEGMLTPEAAELGYFTADGTWVPRIRRVRGLGFVADPNDLAQAILCVLPFLFVMWRRGRPLRNGLMVLLPAAVLTYGIYLTRSRGAMLAFVVLLFVAFQRHLGHTLSLVFSGIGLALIMAVSVGGGRAIAVDRSAYERVEAWYEGLEMLKAHPISGVGYDRFTDYSGRLVAHNSFVHCFAELGVVGYYIWLALIVVTLLQLRQLERLGSSGAPPELARLARAIRLGLIAFLAAAFFLSRTYSPMLFILLGLATATVDIARKERLELLPLPLPVVAALVAAVEALTLVIVYAVVRGIGK